MTTAWILLGAYAAMFILSVIWLASDTKDTTLRFVASLIAFWSAFHLLGGLVMLFGR